MQAKWRQKFLTLIPAPKDKAFLQKMFTAGMIIKKNDTGIYTLKQYEVEAKSWEAFKKKAGKNPNIKSALKALPSSLEEPEKESDTLKPAQVEGDVLSNGIEAGKRQPVKEEEAPAPISLFEGEQKACINYNKARDYYIDENYYKIYGEVETTGTVVYEGGIKTMVEISEREYLWLNFTEIKTKVELNKGDSIKIKGILRKKFITEIIVEKIEKWPDDKCRYRWFAPSPNMDKAKYECSQS